MDTHFESNDSQNEKGREREVLNTQSWLSLTIVALPQDDVLHVLKAQALPTSVTNEMRQHFRAGPVVKSDSTKECMRWIACYSVVVIYLNR